MEFDLMICAAFILNLSILVFIAYVIFRLLKRYR